MRAALIYPHQLFPDHPALDGADICVLVEEPLLFTQYRFHAKKLILHRAAMQSYAAGLRRRGVRVHYVESSEIVATADVAVVLKQLGASQVQFVDPCDDWLQKRLTTALQKVEIQFTTVDDPHFLTPPNFLAEFVAGRKKLHFTEFYVFQRKRLNILLTAEGRPVPRIARNCPAACQFRPWPGLRPMLRSTVLKSTYMSDSPRRSAMRAISAIQPRPNKREHALKISSIGDSARSASTKTRCTMSRRSYFIPSSRRL